MEKFIILNVGIQRKKWQVHVLHKDEYVSVGRVYGWWKNANKYKLELENIFKEDINVNG